MKTTLKTLKTLCAVVTAIAGTSFSTIGTAQNYPTKPVKIILNYAAGGPSDLVGRAMAAKFTEMLGQTFFVENMVSATAPDDVPTRRTTPAVASTAASVAADSTWRTSMLPGNR